MLVIFFLLLNQKVVKLSSNNKCRLCKKKKVEKFNLCKDCYEIATNRWQKLYCEECGYKKCKYCLRIYYVDLDKMNNTLENKKVLCLNCYKELQYELEDEVEFVDIYKPKFGKKNRI